MIEHVYKKANETLDDVLVATDDERILKEVESFGGKAVMTDPQHTTGTSRCWEAFSNLNNQEDYDIVLNIQGDEPMLRSRDLKALCGCFEQSDVSMATLAYSVELSDNPQHGEGVYLVMDRKGHALYFSRNVIPALREPEKNSEFSFFKHIGLYAFRPEALKLFCELPTSRLEEAESLEQNRWLENGGKIQVALVEEPTQAVDYPEDIAKVEEILKRNSGA